MASGVTINSSSSHSRDNGAFSSTAGKSSRSNGQLNSEDAYQLHKAVFHGDLAQVSELLENKLDPNAQDKHGNTPLHIAVMLGHRPIVNELIKHKAIVKEKNRLGWTPLDEAISYGDRGTITLLLKTLRDQTTEGLIQRKQELVRTLGNLDDFYAELRWEFHTWVPLLSRLLPSDVCRIYKTGSCIRLDSTLGDFTEMRWSRGDLTFIFNGEDVAASNQLSIVVLDNKTRQYQRMKLLGSEDVHTDLHDHINMLMSKPIIYANMSTQPIKVVRAQTGWFFKANKSERVGEYDTDVYNITDLILIQRRRREHLTPEQIREHEQLRARVETGNLGVDDLEETEDNEDEEERETVPSLAPPPECEVTWEEYIHAPSDSVPHLGRKMDLKIERKHFKASVCVTDHDNCPIEMKKLLDILEVIAPYKHFHKLRQFVDLKLPPGFPVKLDIPVFPTVTAIVTLERYERKQSHDTLFFIPRDYKKFVPKSSGEQQNSSNSSTNKS